MSDERVLSGSPRMLPLFARAGAAMIPGSSRLPFIGLGGRQDDVPDTVLVLDDVRTDRARLASYDKVCGFPLRDQLPCTYPHMLAFPLHLRLMTDPAFPFPALGLIHLRNAIYQRRPILADEALSLRVWATSLEPHPRGTQFTLRSEARSEDELVWEETSTILRRGEGSGENETQSHRPAVAVPPGDEELPVTATWRLPGDLGRRYAGVSGDFNPIHIHPVSARLLGFPTAIVHGMWTKARCLAALDPQLPDSFTAEASFRKPILLPATVEFGERADAGGISFSVRGAGKGTPHLDGRVSHPV
jgi:acyl dehydratase